MKKQNNLIATVLILFFIISLITYVAYDFIKSKEAELYKAKYERITKSVHDSLDILIEKKKNASLAMTLATVYGNNNINKVIFENKDINLKDLSQQLKEYTQFKNIWFHVIDANGKSLYRSWTDFKNDNVKEIRVDVKKILNEPKIQNSISVGKFDLTIKSMIPIKEKGIFIGVIELISHFNSIAKNLENSFKVDSAILVEKEFYDQLKEKSFSKKFIGKYYVANLDLKDSIYKYLEFQDIENLTKNNSYIIKDDYLIINYFIKENEKKLANFLIFKKLNTIDFSDINNFKKSSILYLVLIILLICLSFFVAYYYIYSGNLKKVYEKLDKSNAQLDKMNLDLQKSIEKEIQRNSEKNRILFQQNKMAAMGEMLENIAHQWRQPLSLITTEASSIKLKKDYGLLSDDEHYRSLESIITTANYLSTTVDDFRLYFSPDKIKNKFVSKDIIEKCIKLFNYDIKNNGIKIVKKIEKFEIYTYENELIQVIINIINNAKDQLLKEKNIDSRYIFIDFIKSEKNAILTIKDSAGGIDEDIIDRIFEPYFTTKHKSRGTGIGLYMSEEIVKRHIKGKILVKNSRFKYKDNDYTGALFEITIPLR